MSELNLFNLIHVRPRVYKKGYNGKTVTFVDVSGMVHDKGWDVCNTVNEYQRCKAKLKTYGIKVENEAKIWRR